MLLNLYFSVKPFDNTFLLSLLFVTLKLKIQNQTYTYTRYTRQLSSKC